jgi:hypothetical protein
MARTPAKTKVASAAARSRARFSTSSAWATCCLKGKTVRKTMTATRAHAGVRRPVVSLGEMWPRSITAADKKCPGDSHAGAYGLSTMPIYLPP